MDKEKEEQLKEWERRYIDGDKADMIQMSMRDKEIDPKIKILNEVKSLENRLLCYHNGEYGRSRVKMSVELKIIKNIKDLLNENKK